MFNAATYGKGKPEYRPYAQAYSELNLDYATSDVLEAFRSDVFSGVGSLEADIQAARMTPEEELGYGPVSMYERFFGEKDESAPLTEEQWKESDYYREGLTYTEGTTEEIARMRTQNYDAQRERDAIISSSTTGQAVAGFGYGLAAGIFEPKNLITGLFTAGVGAGLKATTRGASIVDKLNRMGKYKSQFSKAAIEGGAAAAIAEPSNIYSARTLQSDYTMTDTLLNIGGSVALSGVITGGKALVNKLRNITPEVKTQALDTAIAQVSEGRAVDVEPLLQNDPTNKPTIMAVTPLIEQPLTQSEIDAGVIIPKSADSPPAIELKEIPNAIDEADIVNQPELFNEKALAVNGELQPATTGGKKPILKKGGYVIREKNTLRGVREFYPNSPKSLNEVETKLNKKYEVVPTRQYLEELNAQIKAKSNETYESPEVYAERTTSPESLTATDPEVAQRVMESERISEQETLEYYEQQIESLRTQNLLSEEDLEVMQEAIDIERDAQRYAASVNVAANCLTRG